MIKDSQFVICDRRYFGEVCQGAQDSWEDLERSYRDYDGDIIDHDEYDALYVLRMEWVLEKVIPQNHPCFEDHKTHHNIARHLVEEYSEANGQEGEDPFFWRNYYIEDSEIDELYEFLTELFRDYVD
jgi:hypothetical protein